MENKEIDEKIIVMYNNKVSIREISRELLIGRYRIRKVLNLLKPKQKVCVECNDSFTTKYNTTLTCSSECRREYRKKYMKSRNYEYDKVKDWRLKNKKLSIEYKGGKCIVCDYNRSTYYTFSTFIFKR